jgi:hypothetical protein
MSAGKPFTGDEAIWAWSWKYPQEISPMLKQAPRLKGIWRNWGLAPRIRNNATRWTVVSWTPQPLHTGQKTQECPKAVIATRNTTKAGVGKFWAPGRPGDQFCTVAPDVCRCALWSFTYPTQNFRVAHGFVQNVCIHALKYSRFRCFWTCWRCHS